MSIVWLPIQESPSVPLVKIERDWCIQPRCPVRVKPYVIAALLPITPYGHDAYSGISGAVGYNPNYNRVATGFGGAYITNTGASTAPRATSSKYQTSAARRPHICVFSFYVPPTIGATYNVFSTDPGTGSNHVRVELGTDGILVVKSAPSLVGLTAHTPLSPGVHTGVLVVKYATVQTRDAELFVDGESVGVGTINVYTDVFKPGPRNYDSPIHTTAATSVQVYLSAMVEPYCDPISLSRNPWQIFTPQTHLIPILIPTASGEAYRALVLVDGVVREVTDDMIGSGLKPLVLLDDGRVKEREAVEGRALIIMDGMLFTIPENGTLRI